MTRRGAALLLCLLSASAAPAGEGVAKRRRPLPHEYGQVVMDNHAERGRVAPVVFEHWLHRAKFTCRLCHVDLGFAMKAKGTDVKAADNAAGYYCGACHDGKSLFDGKPLFDACPKNPTKEARASAACQRCHSLGKGGRPAVEFRAFVKQLPPGRFGNGVDWEKAEQDGLISPADFLEKVSIKRPALAAQKDFALSPKLLQMPEIVFSHQKHTVWNGCELCHPEIFVGVKRGATRYSMVEIFDGKYCGACHTSVAFPLLDCQRCHTRPVQGDGRP